MSTLTVKRGDTAQTITDTLLLNGSAINLTGATVSVAWRLRTGTLVVVRTATIVNAATGQVSYQFVDGDLDTSGEYLLEWHVVLSSGRLSIPTADQHVLQVVQDLTEP